MQVKSLFESTAVYTDDGTQVAVRSYRKDGPRVTMLVTKDDWEQMKQQRAHPEDNPTMVATAGSIVDDWEKSGAEIYWKSAADYNQEARDMENHRFRNDPDVSSHFDNSINTARDSARSTMKNNLRTVESMNMTFKEYLIEAGQYDNIVIEPNDGRGRGVAVYGYTRGDGGVKRTFLADFESTRDAKTEFPNASVTASEEEETEEARFKAQKDERREQVKQTYKQIFQSGPNRSNPWAQPKGTDTSTPWKKKT